MAFVALMQALSDVEPDNGRWASLTTLDLSNRHLTSIEYLSVLTPAITTLTAYAPA